MNRSALKIAAIILAAGRSKRMGEVNKLLVNIEGSAMVSRTLDQVLDIDFADVVLVSGHQSFEVAGEVGDREVRIIENRDFANGLSTSLKTGIENLGAHIDGALVVLADMPLVCATDLQQIIGGFASRSDVCVPYFQKRQGNPVLWGRNYFAAICDLRGDRGAKLLLERYQANVVQIEMSSPGILRDFDQPADFD